MPDTLNLPLTPEEEARFKRRYSDLIKKLVHTTRFSKDEVESLLVMHFKLERAGGPLGYERAAEVLYSLLGMTDELLTIRVCDLLDRENARKITMESWVVGLSLLLRGSFEERIQLCFKDMVLLVMNKMDLDRDGKISFEDFHESVTQDPLMMQCLGRCLPTQRAACKFLITLSPKICRY
ncbi:calaxin-like [Schistocerca serialis cubense]|uniref:calaxin-like n=1 Tax=Schistocerca serialis cubense TaxID=2023355 RepID=UPI00214E8561|nr:calaxin-like [Schistocerca serialis cubense]